MTLALLEARAAAARGEVPVGAAVVRDGSRYALWVAGILRDRDHAPTALGAPKVLATLAGAPTALAWLDAGTLAVLESDDTETVLYTHEIGAFGDALRGPAGVPLRSRLVQTLALALHELTTNALKYGALSDAGGRLEVAWCIVGHGEGRGPALHVTWHERGVRVEPGRTADGYGRELIERALPYQLKAQTTYELRRDGVFCTIEVPFDEDVGGSPP